MRDKRQTIPEDILLPNALKMRVQTGGADPEKWVTHDVETVRSWCGPSYAGVPTDDVRLQCCNLRKGGKLGKIKKGGHGAAKTESPPEDYLQYLDSDHWRSFSEKIKELWEHRCCWCNSGNNLDVHHRTYERLGHEKITDCVCLCRKCHKVADARRKRESAASKANEAMAAIA